ncbi:MAG: DUF1771 domain-containing protein [Candidatus Azambacteria bacterium]|nr:DUF1771 domain-containing protein [Candidatus Azambacteria bacterium]
MRRTENIGKAGLIKIAKNLISQKKELLVQVNNLRLEYQKLLDKDQPKIDEFQAQADNLAKEFKRLYAESQEAYSSGDGALAKSLSLEGRAIEAGCRAINSQANILRNELKSILNKIESLYKEVDELQNRASNNYKQAAAIRRTYVRSFGLSKVVSNDDIEEFLDGFPQKIFGKIESIKFEDKLTGNESATILGNHHWDEKLGKFEIEIYCPISENSLKATIAHEIGHTIFRNFMKGTQRWQWGKWYQESMKNKRFILIEDSGNREDDFCDCFIVFKVNPKRLEKFDKRRYDFIDKIYQKIERGETL